MSTRLSRPKTRPRLPTEVTLGRIRGVFGVRGWLRVESFTEPPDNILDYPCWRVYTRRERSLLRPLEGRLHGPGLVVCLQTETGQPVAERAQAQGLVGAEIRVLRSELPPLADGQVYWVDLVGCAVSGRAGCLLGTVRAVIDAPAHPLLAVADGTREHLIPLVRGPIITHIDIQARRIAADWEPDDAL